MSKPRRDTVSDGNSTIGSVRIQRVEGGWHIEIPDEAFHMKTWQQLWRYMRETSATYGRKHLTTLDRELVAFVDAHTHLKWVKRRELWNSQNAKQYKSHTSFSLAYRSGKERVQKALAG